MTRQLSTEAGREFVAASPTPNAARSIVVDIERQSRAVERKRIIREFIALAGGRGGWDGSGRMMASANEIYSIVMEGEK